MKKLLLVIMLLCGVVMGQEKAVDGKNQPALTIYNQNFFVAREYVPLDLTAGVNRAQYAGIASHLEPDSVILRDPNGRALEVLEQNYRNDPISQELLLSFYEGKTIDFLLPTNQIIKGKVVRSGYIPSTYYAQNYQQPSYTQPIIEVDGVLRFGLPGQPLFPALSGDSILKPTLSWLVRTNDPGKFAGINKVRARAGLISPTQQYSFANVATQSDFVDTLVKERAKELCVEGHRRWDLIRLGRYKQIEAGIGFTLQDYQYLLPLPQTELDANKNLTQNPMY